MTTCSSHSAASSESFSSHSLVLASLLGSVVKAGDNNFTPTKGDHKSAHISPFTGSGTLSWLSFGNPESGS